MAVTTSPSFAFPAPTIYRSTSAHAQIPSHSPSPSVLRLLHYIQEEELTHGLANVSLTSDEALIRFQKGQLPEQDQEWHRLVPPEAREALGKQEVHRQSVIFEVVKAERDYVADLEAVQDVFINGLKTANPPLINESKLQGFLNEVFGNLHLILGHHQQMLAALFHRQRDQHPLVQSVADIVLDMTLESDFRTAYETYIKHYPLAESHHRKELKRNKAYKTFIQSVSSDPRIRKRDLITFLSRPVTRLPRLNLVLEEILKLTDKEYEHPDLETLPIILRILSDCIKSTQPGIEAAESKVKFWEICESLVYQKGEIIDMDLHDESRALVYDGPVVRKTRSETGILTEWQELDGVFVLARKEKRPNGAIKRVLMSRPIPLAYLQLAPFDSSAESRRERAEESNSILDSLRYTHVPIYPFTIYHSSARSTRRYTLYVASEAIRKKWKAKFEDAIGIWKVRQEGNMWFAPNTTVDGFFRVTGSKTSFGTKLTGRVTSAVPFVSGGKKFLAIAAATGIYVSTWGEDKFRKVLAYTNPNAIFAIQTIGDHSFNKFVIHSEPTLVSYSLDMLARVATGQASPGMLDASMEKIGGGDSMTSQNIVFSRYVVFGKKALLIYASKRRLGTTLTLNVLQAVDSSDILSPKRASAKTPSSFVVFGEPGFIPKDAYDISPLVKTVGICTHDGIVIADPTNLARSVVTIVPDLQETTQTLGMSLLKQRIDPCKPLGLIRVNDKELLVVYDQLGCYITKRGIPTRSCGYIKWETPATSYTARGEHILLFSTNFIEIRNISTGRIVQVIEGKDIRLLYGGPLGDSDPILVAMWGERDDEKGASEKIIELVETKEIGMQMPPTPSSASSFSSAGGSAGLWDEWDM
ncbi:hypothetical protein BDQ17DRAFT_1399669 [Cyathus striatus]|nr:hypothetical protein BDQ17DRAFT_1399669 [Cyathus striatus]